MGLPAAHRLSAHLLCALVPFIRIAEDILAFIPSELGVGCLFALARFAYALPIGTHSESMEFTICTSA